MSDTSAEAMAVYKMLIVGDESIGKSMFVMKWTNDIFTDKYQSTIGIDFFVKTVEVEKESIRGQIWDTSGNPKYTAITTAYYNGADGMILAFDITKEESFEKLDSFLEQINSVAPDSIKVLMGCKSDLADNRAVTTAVAQEYADKNGMKYFETSAKEGTNVAECILYLMRKIYEVKNPKPVEPVKPVEPAKPREEPATPGTGAGTVPAVQHPSEGGLLQRFQVPLAVLLAALSIYVVNKYFFKSSN